MTSPIRHSVLRLVAVVGLGTLGALGTMTSSLHQLPEAFGVAALDHSAQAAAAPDADPRPNIVFVTTDDMSSTDLAHMPATQSLLVSRGVSFANSFAPFSLCCPNRVSMLTGQYAHNHKALGNATPEFPLGGYPGFNTDGNTFAKWLHDVGYQTAYVGKYLNGYGSPTPGPRVPSGWDRWHGSRGDYYAFASLFENGKWVKHLGYAPDIETQISVDIIDEQMADGGPLLLWTSYFAPHSGSPTDPDDCIHTHGRSMHSPSPSLEDRDTFPDEPLPQDPSFNEADVSDKPRVVQNLPILDDTKVTCLTEVNRQRLETLQAVDRGVAELVSSVEAAGELDNTIFVFTSDNGYLIGQHRVPQGKVLPYEPSIRVPLVIRGPGFPEGVTRDQLVASIDIAPTFASIAGALPRRKMDGLSLLPLAVNPLSWKNRDIVIEAGPKTVNGPMMFTGVRSQRYTYVEYATGEKELYDLPADPYQLANSISDPAYAQVRQTLAAELALMRKCSGKTCRAPTPH